MSEQPEAPETEPDQPPKSEPHHLAPDDAGPRPWVDPAKDPTPGYPGHAAPEPEA